MFLEKFGIFIIFLGPLVFFHELGHFLFARLFGVRVEVFSIGFGPKILKVKKGFTEYAVSLIPLGGYVKMFGDDPLNKDKIAQEDRAHSFTHKGKWARFWIVMGGPLANFILAFFVYFSLMLMGEKVPEIKFGQITEGSALYKTGFRSGDIVKEANGKEVTNPSDFILNNGEKINSILVNRLGVDVKVAMDFDSQQFFEEFVKHPPVLMQPVIVNRDGEFFGVSFSKDKVNWEASLEQVIQNRGSNSLYLIPLKISDEQKSDSPFIKYVENGNGELFVSAESTTLTLSKLFENERYRGTDLIIKSVNMNSPADKAGLKAGDVIVKIEDKSISSFEALRKSLELIDSDSVKVSFWRKGKEHLADITPDKIVRDGKTIKIMGVHSGISYQKLKFIETKPKTIIEAISIAADRTYMTSVKTLDGFKKLFTADVSLKTIGGPLAIGKVASDSFNTSLSYFFQLMAIFSINLGIINLFPIPVLDGGHIMFIFLEILNRGPVSRRKMEIAQQFGLSVLLILMVGALFNDITNFF